MRLLITPIMLVTPLHCPDELLFIDEKICSQHWVHSSTAYTQEAHLPKANDSVCYNGTLGCLWALACMDLELRQLKPWNHDVFDHIQETLNASQCGCHGMWYLQGPEAGIGHSWWHLVPSLPPHHSFGFEDAEYSVRFASQVAQTSACSCTITYCKRQKLPSMRSNDSIFDVHMHARMDNSFVEGSFSKHLKCIVAVLIKLHGSEQNV